MVSKIIDTASAAFNLRLTPVQTGSVDSIGELIVVATNMIALIAGAAAFIYLVYSGFLYITAAGNEKNAEQGQKGITWAIIGIIVILAAYILVNSIANTSSWYLNGNN